MLNKILTGFLILLFLSLNFFILSGKEISSGKLIRAGVGIGEFTLGNYKLSDIKKIFGEPDTQRTEGTPKPAYLIIGYSSQARAFGFSLNSDILEILVTSNSLDKTKEGFHVGSNIEEVKKVYKISQTEGGHNWIIINNNTIEKVKGKVDNYKLEKLKTIPSLNTAYHEEAWDTILGRLNFTSSEIEIIKSYADKTERITYMSDGIKFVCDSNGTIITILVSKIFK